MVNMTQVRMETFTSLLILTKVLGVALLITIMTWLGSYRGGFKWQSEPSLQFNWHPILMTIGMIVLYGYAILTYRALKNTKKYTAKLIHAALNLIGFFCTVIGLQAVFDSHNLASPPIPNMYTLHSWVGLLSVILFACQWTAGLITFLFPGLNPSCRATYLPIHVYFGLFGFVFGTMAALMGLLEKAIFSVKHYSEFIPEGVLINVIGVMILTFSSLVVYLVAEPKYKRPASTEDQNLLTPKDQTNEITVHQQKNTKDEGNE